MLFNTKMKKISILNLILSISFLATPKQAFANVQICQIRHSKEEVNDKRTIPKSRNLLKNNQEVCRQIGTQFNQFGNAEKDKPIYACCRPEN